MHMLHTGLCRAFWLTEAMYSFFCYGRGRRHLTEGFTSLTEGFLEYDEVGSRICHAAPLSEWLAQMSACNINTFAFKYPI